MTTEEIQVPENEMRLTYKTSIPFAVKRIEEILNKFDHITLSGMNSVISKVLLLTEITKLKIHGLHQYNLLETITMELKEENKENDPDQKAKYLTRFKVELYKEKPSTAPKGFYEAPYTEEEIKKISEVKPPETRGEGEERGRGRGFRGRGRRGRGRGRFRGGGRGERRGDRGRGRPRGDRPSTTRGQRSRPRVERGGERGGERGRGGRGRGGRGGQRPETATEGRRNIPGLGKGPKSGIN